MPTVRTHLDRLAGWLDLPPNVLIVIAGIYVALLLGSVARLTHLHELAPEQARSLRARLATWWVITIIMTLVVLLGRPAIVLLAALVSALALREYFSLLPDRERYRRVLPWAYAVIPIQYLLIYLGLDEPFLLFVPVLAFLLLTLRVVLLRQPDGFTHMVGTLQWAMMLLVYCLSHAAALLALPDGPNPAGGAIGWFIYLVVLTELNDIAQALWGRRFGRHKIIAEVSAGKSWEGLLGAAACTIIAAMLLAPLLTPLGQTPPRFDGTGTAASALLSPWAALAGLMIAVAGFFGDITMSAVKRDVHVKDSGTMLPGQGGILDRVDSLTFTAPIFFHYVRYLYEPGA